MNKFFRSPTTAVVDRPKERPAREFLKIPGVIYESNQLGSNEILGQDEVDRATPSTSLFDPNSTSTSIWEYEYEDDLDDHHDHGQYNSLPIQVAHLNNLDSVYFSNTNNEIVHSWEAEDVGDFITTLDESITSDIPCLDLAKPAMNRIGKVNRPKSLYEPSIQFTIENEHILPDIMVTSGGPVEKYPKIMTTSCYGALTSSVNQIGSDPCLEYADHPEFLCQSTLAQLDGNSRLWMASTEELIKLNHDISNIIHQRVAVDVHQPYSPDTSITEENIVSLENSYCEHQQQQTGTASALASDMTRPPRSAVDIAEIAESDLQSIRKLLNGHSNNSHDAVTNDGVSCPSCELPFDKGKKRKLIDSCGHERCFSCMFKNEKCPICNSSGRRSSLQRSSDIHKSSTNVNDDQLYGGSRASCNGSSSSARNLKQSRFGSVSQLLQINRKDQKEANGRLGDDMDAEETTTAAKHRVCPTPPQNHRRFFSPKNLRSPFNKRRTGAMGSAAAASGAANYKPQTGGDHHSRSRVLSDEEETGAFQYRARVSDLDDNIMKQPGKSYSSLASANTSPVSTLTGSSDADMSRVLQDSGIYTAGSNSIGSIMSISISEKSTSSLSPVVRRHSLTASQNSEDQAPFKNRLMPARRSARAAITTKATIEGPLKRSPHPGVPLTLKPLFFEVPTQEQEPLFVGRQWLLRDISNTLNNADSPGVLIQGSPGTGKTTICLQLVEYSCFGRRRNCHPVDNDGLYSQINVVNDRIKALSSYVVAYHFCQADNNSTCLVPDFIHSLAAQLCQAPQLSSYRDHLLSETHLQNVLSVKECIADPERALKMGILEPLISLRKSGHIASKTCVILIDGVCEAEYHRPDQGDTIGSFLARMVTYFPAWLKIIVTVRTQMMEYVKLTALSRFNLDGNTEAVQKDVYEYCNHRIKTNATIQNNIQVPGESAFAVQTKFVQYLMNLAKGSYLFAKLTLDLIESGHLIIKSNTFKVVPVTLAQIFLLKFNLKFPTTAKFERVANVLNICLATLYPLTQTEIFYTLNAMQTQTALPWGDFVETFNELADVLVKRSDGTFMFFHPSLREWLIRRDASDSSKFLCDNRIGHSAIAFRLSRMQAPLDSEQVLELGHHILKAHIYRNSNSGILPRDLQAYWITSVAKHIESALCTLRNVYSPNIKVSRLLLLAGASPNYTTDILGKSPILAIAASEGITPMVNLLLEFGADVEQTNSQGNTALILASAKGHFDVVRQLVASGAALGHTDHSNRCALVHAARSGKLNVLKYLLSCDWITRAGSDDVRMTEAVQQALVCASEQGNSEEVEELLEVSHEKIDEQDSITGETALIAAAKNGHIDIITCLLARSARVDGTNKKNVNALMVAAKEGHVSVVERLMQFSAVDLDRRDDDGKTALIYASQENHVDIIQLFLNQEGIDTEVVDNEGMTALSWSCLRGHLTATAVLLDNMANIHHTDGTGRTPLDLAAYQGSAALAQLLIDRGSTLEHVDLNGMRPLDRAIACRNIQIVPVFLKKGAKLGPATWEMAFGKPEILLLLLNKLLEDGNTLYRKNRLQEASHRYQYALKKFPAGPTDHLKTFTQLKINFLLNHSRCNRKMKNIAEAIDLASDAIQLNPNNYEGYHLRAKAYLEQEDFEMALSDSKIALKLSQMTASAEIKTILIRYHDEVIRLQAATESMRTTDL